LCGRRQLPNDGVNATGAAALEKWIPSRESTGECQPMKKTERVRNYLKAAHFDHPDWVPAAVSILPAAWLKYGQELEDVVLGHPKLFPGYNEGQFKTMTLGRRHQVGRWQDAWGVVWDNAVAGISSIPVECEAPLRDWAAFDRYVPPDPLKIDDLGNPIDWGQRAEHIAKTKENGGLASGGLSHGFMYMRLFYLRGFSNLMLDIATRDPRLDKLIKMVLNHNVTLVRKYVSLGIEHLGSGDDLGMQTALPMRPEDWRRYLKPCYDAIFGPCRNREITVYLHTDGHILPIISDLIDCGVNIINPQIRANGLDGLVRFAKGNVCIRLDLDRQLFPFAAPSDLRKHIREAMDALYMPEGGLMLSAECAHDVPIENIRAICETFEEIGCGP